jgi:ssDNA-binding Zn-finger/Zn-ribbon topoisomerase 1
VGCSRYPECNYIRKTGAAALPPLPFAVVCPKCGEGQLQPRRARRTGAIFWGCTRYPNCDYTTSYEPTGAVHDADSGPVARKKDGALCLVCGAPVELPEGELAGRRLAGGEPNPGALVRRSRGGARRGRTTGGTKARTKAAAKPRAKRGSRAQEASAGSA